MKKSDSIGKIAEALSKAQALIIGAKKDSANPFFSSSYADLESVIEAVKEPIKDLGLAHSQLGGYEGEKFGITTIIMHTSGEWISGFYPVLCKDPNNPQSLLAAATYARRGSLAAAYGVPQIDDDGNTAAKAPVKAKEEPKSTSAAIAKHIPKEPKPAQPGTPPAVVSAAQVSRLWAIQRNSDKSIADVMAKMKEKYQVTEAEKLTWVQYGELIKWVENK